LLAGGEKQTRRKLRVETSRLASDMVFAFLLCFISFFLFGQEKKELYLEL
jgi:hypothetical protein